MTYADALKEVNRLLTEGIVDPDDDDYDFFITVEVSLEKQISIAPEVIAEDDDGIYKQYICPKCERFLTFGNPVPFERPHHCRCGQKLLWRTEDEE